MEEITNGNYYGNEISGKIPEDADLEIKMKKAKIANMNIWKKQQQWIILFIFFVFWNLSIEIFLYYFIWFLSDTDTIFNAVQPCFLILNLNPPMINWCNLSHWINTQFHTECIHTFTQNRYTLSHRKDTDFHIEKIHTFTLNAYTLSHQIDTHFHTDYIHTIILNAYTLSHWLHTHFHIECIHTFTLNSFTLEFKINTLHCFIGIHLKAVLTHNSLLIWKLFTADSIHPSI